VFPRHTLETTIFRDPTERPPKRHQDDQYRQLYITGFRPFPTPQRINEGNVPSVVDENQLRRLYAATVSLMRERRGLTRDQMLSLSTTIENNLRSPQPLPEMDN
jgi:hypothetical protein